VVCRRDRGGRRHSQHDHLFVGRRSKMFRLSWSGQNRKPVQAGSPPAPRNHGDILEADARRWLVLGEGHGGFFPAAQRPAALFRRPYVMRSTRDPGIGKTYAVLLNSPPSQNFTDQEGRKALTYLLAFSTK
jgi:hypothetical protein